MADQGASRASSEGEIPFSVGVSLRDTTVEVQTSTLHVAVTAGDLESNKGAGEGAKKLSETFAANTSRAGRSVAPVVHRTFLGWDGSTPVRWTTTDTVVGRDGLTNVTVEKEWLEGVPEPTSST